MQAAAAAIILDIQECLRRLDAEILVFSNFWFSSRAEKTLQAIYDTSGAVISLRTLTRDPPLPVCALLKLKLDEHVDTLVASMPAAMRIPDRRKTDDEDFVRYMVGCKATAIALAKRTKELVDQLTGLAA